MTRTRPGSGGNDSLGKSVEVVDDESGEVGGSSLRGVLGGLSGWDGPAGFGGSVDGVGSAGDGEFFD